MMLALLLAAQSIALFPVARPPDQRGSRLLDAVDRAVDEASQEVLGKSGVEALGRSRVLPALAERPAPDAPCDLDCAFETARKLGTTYFATVTCDGRFITISLYRTAGPELLLEQSAIFDEASGEADPIRRDARTHENARAATHGAAVTVFERLAPAAPPAPAAARVGAPGKVPLFFVALLERNGAVTQAESSALEQRLRDLCAELLPADKLLVLTGDNTLQILEERGLDAAKITEAGSNLEAARLIGAQDYLSGALQKVGGKLQLTLRLNDGQGKRLSSAEAEAKDAAGLQAMLRDLAAEVLRPLLPARAAVHTTLAVLEFDNELKGADAKLVDRVYFSDQVRGAVREAVPGASVMTRENTVQLLKSFGKKLEDCTGECEVETGKLLQADHVVSGRLTKVGSRFKLTLRLHETGSGALVGSAVASGKSVEELDDETPKAVAHLLAPLQKR